MDHARVGIFEDYPQIRQTIILNVEEAGHEVVAAAGNMDEARAAIGAIEGVDVAIVDGNLTSGDISGRDGEEIARLLHERFSAVVVVGFSGTGEVRGADHCVMKGYMSDVLQIIEAI